MKKYIHKTVYHIKICGMSLLIGIIIGQFLQPIPLERRNSLPVVGDVLPDLEFADDGFDLGYSDNDREMMDRLVASSLKQAR